MDCWDFVIVATGLRGLDPLLEKRFDLFVADANVRCLGPGCASLAHCLVGICGLGVDHDELVVLVVAVCAFGPEAARLEGEDAGEGDAADEVVRGELERRVAQRARDGVAQLVRRERGELREDA